MTFKTLTLAAATAALVFTASGAAQAADSYKFDPNHTSVIWNADHFGYSKPHGIFSQIEGTLSLDEADPAKSNLNVTIPTDKIATGIPKFDEHLKGKDFFDVAAHPTATFVSKKVEVTGKDTAKVTGDLTLVGITKPVTLNVKLNKNAPNAMNNKPTVGFSATTKIKRSEFGIKYAIPGVSDEVDLVIEAEANKDS